MSIGVGVSTDRGLPPSGTPLRRSRHAVAPLWNPEELARFFSNRLGQDLERPLEPKEILRGAVRLSADCLEGTYELASEAFRGEGPCASGGPEFVSSRRVFIRIPLEEVGTGLGVARIFLSPDDPRLDVRPLFDPPFARWLARAVAENPDDVSRHAISPVAHRLGSRILFRASLEFAAKEDPAAHGGRRRVLAVKMRRRPPSHRLVFRDPGSAFTPSALGIAARKDHAAPGLASLDVREWTDAPALHERLAAAGPPHAGRRLFRDLGSRLAQFHLAARLEPVQRPAESPSEDSLLPSRLPATELAALGQLAEGAAALFENVEGPVRTALERLARDERARPARRPADRVVIHGDLHDKQILLDGERPVFIDLDSAALGEPELDLGNLAAHFFLRALQGRIPLERARDGGEALIEGYVEGRGAVDPVSLSFYRRATLLRLALLYLMRLNWSHLFGTLLDEERALRETTW